MAPKDNEGFDDIFASTAKKPKKKATKKKAPATKSAPKKVVSAAVPSRKTEKLAADPTAVLQTAWTNHKQEVLYRKAKEDRLLVFTVSVLIALTAAVAYLLHGSRLLDWSGFYRFIMHLFFAGVVLGVAFAGNALMELNRKRLQDVLAMIVKIQESLGLFDEGAVPGSDGAFFPNTYKFVGSMNDDETNYAQMILKVSAAAAAFTILLLV
ncbi:MAG: hypothetical protein P9L99_14915 [Candidatus Lernaella stagnicola]|nr:hypothetical protein [Candidatus Lernaella stagnicola]